MKPNATSGLDYSGHSMEQLAELERHYHAQRFQCSKEGNTAAARRAKRRLAAIEAEKAARGIAA